MTEQKSGNLSGTIRITSRCEATLTWHGVWEGLIGSAQRRLTEGDSSLAVVVAVTATETIAERVITQMWSQKDMMVVGEAVDSLILSYSLKNERVRNLFVSLTGDEIHKKSFWKTYTRAVKARHEVVHKGGKVEIDDAKEFVSACAALVDYLHNKYFVR